VRGGFARLATVLREIRGGGDPVLLLHGGDAVSGSGTDYLWNSQPDYARIPTYGWRGIDVVDTMSLLGFDAMVIGNHELDCGRRWLELRMEQASCAVVSANVLHRNLPDIDGSTGKPLAKPYVVVTKGNLRIGIIGLTTTSYIMSSQVQVKDPLPILRALVPEVSKQCDVLIVLSHVGYDQDLEMARDVPDIDVIVGGHTHTLFPEPVVVGSTLVVQDGEFAEQVGILDLTITNGTIASHRYQLKRLDPSVPEDPAVDAALRRFLAIGSVGEKKLAAVKYQRNDLGSLATSAMLAATGADAAMIASDSMSGALGPGSPTVQEFFDVFWPYHSRSLMPEKDLDERQMISTLVPQGGSVSAALRAVVRASDGLRTLVVAGVPAAAFAAWLAVNEGRVGGPDYVQVDLRAPQTAVSAAASGQTRSVVMPIDLAMRIGRLGLDVDPKRLEVKRVELFEAVLSLLGTPAP
jgi:2',3'-cyclic-nucleotide 2'-phosphodiesterase (5'-nucleotidase family)